MEFITQGQDQDLDRIHTTYQSTTYKDNRTKIRSFVIDVDETGSGTTLLNFSKTLGGPLIIDKLCDVYLDSFISYYGKSNNSTSTMGFLLDIDQFNIQTASAQNDNISDKIYIPNNLTSSVTAVVNGAISSTTAVVVDGNVGTIVTGMIVTGTGITADVFVSTVTDQQNLVLSSAQSISDGVVLSFTNSTSVHKGKKFNYICPLNPTKLYKITGSITNCPVSGTAPETIFHKSHGRFIAEFIIVDRDPKTEVSPIEIYQPPSYLFERLTQKSMVVDKTIGTDTSFSVNLQEPLIIDALSDIYLDSFTTFNGLMNNTGGNSSVLAFLLGIDQFTIHTRSTNTYIFDRIMIPNEATTSAGTIVHKGRKMNYVCSINPTTLSTISGIISRCPYSTWSGTDPPITAFASGGRFIAEFLIIAR